MEEERRAQQDFDRQQEAVQAAEAAEKAATAARVKETELLQAKKVRADGPSRLR